MSSDHREGASRQIEEARAQYPHIGIAWRSVSVSDRACGITIIITSQLCARLLILCHPRSLASSHARARARIFHNIIDISRAIYQNGSARALREFCSCHAGDAVALAATATAVVLRRVPRPFGKMKEAQATQNKKEAREERPPHTIVVHDKMTLPPPPTMMGC